MHVALAGPEDAPPVVLVHGWPQNWWAWRRVIPGLVERFRVIAPDLRGFGDTSKAESHSLAALDLPAVASLAAVAAFHSSAACGRHVRLAGAPTYPGHDTAAPSGPRFAGQREVGEQSPIGSALAPTTQWLESVVSPRHENRVVLQQRFPYPVTRSVSIRMGSFTRETLRRLRMARINRERD